MLGSNVVYLNDFVDIFCVMHTFSTHSLFQKDDNGMGRAGFHYIKIHLIMKWKDIKASYVFLKQSLRSLFEFIVKVGH